MSYVWLPEDIWNYIFEFDPTFRKDIWEQVMKELREKITIHTELISWKIDQLYPSYVEKREWVWIFLTKEKKLKISIWTYATNIDSNFLDFGFLDVQ